MIDRRGHIAGWDLRLSSVARERLARTDAPRVLHEAYWFALAQAARAVAESPRASLLTAPAPALADAAFVQQLPEGTLLTLDETHEQAYGERAADVAATLRARRLRVAALADHALADAADFLLLDADRIGATDALRRLGTANGHAHHWIATNLSSFEDVSAAVRSGAAYCCGAYARASQRPGNTRVPASAVSAAHLLSAVVAGRPPRELADLIKSDVALSYRLLRLVNSAAFAAGRPVDSIEQALLLLGTKELHRWLCVLLLTADTGSAIAPALHETALARGRLLELLAIARGRVDPPDALFVTGAFSMLDLLLNVPLEVALALTPLPDAATEAMIAESGPWRGYLEVALGAESGDGARVEAGCAALALDVDGVTALAVQAGHWAQQAAAGLSNEPTGDPPTPGAGSAAV
jgi:EAL and modified HD-GYP domain-containing signal transduction protein